MSRQSVRRYLLPVNHCGPRDDFDAASSHVIPALTKECADARHSRATGTAGQDVPSGRPSPLALSSPKVGARRL